MIRKYLTIVPGLVLCVPLIIGASTLGFSASASAQSAPQCSSAATDPDGDGWGYEHGRSCRAPTASSGDRTVQSTHPACTTAAINNGGGWGWENNRSCRYTAGSSAPSGGAITSRPVCTSAAINNGDGWGWENNQPCVYSATSNAPSNDDPTGGNNSGGAPQCSARAVDNGDGWGFEFGASCVWGDFQPGSDFNSSEGAAPPPVAAASPGFDNTTGRPICLTDSSDGNGDGFGYENDQTCRVVDGTTATASRPLLNQRWCQPWAEISYGDYVLQNNTWNDSDVFYDTWSQCIELGGSCLLYTSPSPRDKRQSRMPSSA